MAGRIYPLFMLQDPRRNLYAPIYKARFLQKGEALIFFVLSYGARYRAAYRALRRHRVYH